MVMYQGEGRGGDLGSCDLQCGKEAQSNPLSRQLCRTVEASSSTSPTPSLVPVSQKIAGVFL